MAKLTSNVGAPVADNQKVKRRHIANCAKADAAYGAGVVKALGM